MINKKQSMSKILMLVAMMPVFATAATTYTGLTEVTDVSTLNGTDGNIVLGRGTLKYTGPSGTVAKDIAIAPSGGKLDTTVDVTDGEATLTVSGDVTTQTSNSQFLKKGPGTLRLSGTGTGQRLGYGTSSGSGVPAWGADGYATSGAYPFTLAEGRILIDGSGSTWTLGNGTGTGSAMARIGGMTAGTAASAVLEVANGASVAIPYNYPQLYSNGTTEAPQDATLHIHDGGAVSYSGAFRFVNFRANTGAARVIVDNGRLSISQRVYLSDCAQASDISIILTNRAQMTHSMWNNNGFTEGSSAGLMLDITHSATGKLALVNFGVNASVKVHDGGVLLSDRSVSTSAGNHLFDGGTWGSRSSTISLWGGSSSAVLVGAGGMALATDGSAYLNVVPSAAEGAEESALLSKVGSGTVALRAGTQIPLTVTEGSVSFPDPAPLFASSYGNEQVTVQPGAGLVANGEGSWNGKAIVLADGARLAFAAQGARNDFATTTVAGAGLKLPDGTAMPVCMNMSGVGSEHAGSIWANQRIRVDRSFTLAFETCGVPNSTTMGKAAFFVVFHNSPNETAANCGGGNSNGLGNTLKNGYAIGVRPDSRAFAYGFGQGTESGDVTIAYKAAGTSFASDVTCADLLGRPEAPTFWRVAYDNEAKTLTMKFKTAKGAEKAYSRTAVDLATYCVTNEVLFGFTASTKTCVYGIQVANLREVGEARRGIIRTGGDVTVPAGATVAATVSSTEFANGFTAKSLTYGDGSTLDISTAANAESVSAPYVAFENMGGTGNLVKKGAGNLGFQCPSATGAPNLRLDEGGLVLRKEPLEPLAATMAGGWSFNRNGGGMGYLSATNLWMKTTGFQVGSGTANVNDGVNSRRRVYVAGNWRMRFKAAALARTSANRLYMTLHDQGPDVSIPTGTDRYIMQWYVYESYPSSKQRMNTASVGSALEKVDNKSSYAPINFCTALPGNGGAGPVDVTIEHDASLERVRCIMAQGGICVTNDFANQIVAPASGNGYAYVGFTANTGSKELKMEVTDFSFEQLDGTDPLASSPYASTVEIGEDAGAITLDSPMAGGVFKLADSVTIASGATVRAESCGAAATLDIGTPVCAGDTLALAGDSDSTIRVASMPAGVSRITVDGGAFEPFGSFGARGAELALLGDAKVSASGRVSFSSITVDGVKQSSGVYTAENCSFVRGAGSLAVGLGTIIIVR